eukprot:TRINITY_DN27786_c0_g1_i3.p2 TRINITY_DN27786_c0_g1~~TRINITY_DN27786_c0_g1_i3.p2  ORF type:complete len:131 (+),score=26.99 TRINITY_DN27786_c0_g1_i3:119-511(+)
MLRSLVGSEMCIRDRAMAGRHEAKYAGHELDAWIGRSGQDHGSFHCQIWAAPRQSVLPPGVGSGPPVSTLARSAASLIINNLMRWSLSKKPARTNPTPVHPISGTQTADEQATHRVQHCPIMAQRAQLEI